MQESNAPGARYGPSQSPGTVIGLERAEVVSVPLGIRGTAALRLAAAVSTYGQGGMLPLERMALPTLLPTELAIIIQKHRFKLGNHAPFNQALQT